MKRRASPASGVATYLYCLVGSPAPPRAAALPPGLPGMGRPRVLDAGGRLWLVVADAPLARYGAAPVERGLRDLHWVSTRAMAHEAVVGACTQAGTVIPTKLLTLFTGDDRALAHIHRRRRTVERLLARVAGRMEWGLRVRLIPARALRESRAGVPRATTGVRPGTRFLQLRRRGQEAGHRLAARARAEAERAYRRLRRLADGAYRHPFPTDRAGSPLLLDAAFLVATRGTSGFRSEVDRLAATGSEVGLEVTLTGPWPPYNFVTRRR